MKSEYVKNKYIVMFLFYLFKLVFLHFKNNCFICVVKIKK